MIFLYYNREEIEREKLKCLLRAPGHGWGFILYTILYIVYTPMPRIPHYLTRNANMYLEDVDNIFYL